MLSACVWALLACLNLTSSAILSSVAFALISRKPGSSSSGGEYVAESVVHYDEFGEMPQIRNAFAAVNRGVSIVAVRAENHTVFAYAWMNASALQVPMGAHPFTSLGCGHQWMLVTGLAGDCRHVTRYAKETALNLTHHFGQPPSGHLIAEQVGSLLQRATFGESRPLACHAFMADLLTNALYEVDLTGNVLEVYASAAGIGASAGLKYLEEHWTNTSMSVGETEDLAQRTVTAMLSSRRGGEGAGLSVRLQTLRRPPAALERLEF